MDRTAEPNSNARYSYKSVFYSRWYVNLVVCFVFIGLCPLCSYQLSVIESAASVHANSGNTQTDKLIITVLAYLFDVLPSPHVLYSYRALQLTFFNSVSQAYGNPAPGIPSSRKILGLYAKGIC